MTTSACYNLLLCLNLFYIVALFVYNVLWVATTAWMHRCIWVDKLRIIYRSISFDMLMILSRMACLSAFKSTGRLLYPTEKNWVLLGMAN